MKSYFIGYDLNRPGQNYPELFAAIRAMGGWWHYLDSTWLVRTTLTAQAVRDRLSPHIDRNDELLVAELSGAAAWVGFNEHASTTLKEILSGQTIS
jgi:hypothetical protein